MASELRVDKIVPIDGVPTGGGGGIVQVQMGVTNSQTTTTSGNFDATNLFASITPKFSTSKILIMCSGGMNGPAGGGDNEVIGYKIYRSVGGASFAQVESTNDGQAEFFGRSNTYVPLSINYLDSPSTTSAITYKLYQKRISGSGTPSVNRNSDNQTQMILMEVSA
tara:strand:+ start:43 stop:540 length:498 start_codon:yes stop_codon:yes gene_type:complete